jgi:DNA-binding protein H-NS
MRLDQLNLKELHGHREKVDQAIEARTRIERDEVRKSVEKLCASHGLSLKDLVGKRKGHVLKGTKVAAKYKGGAGETWSGRGRRPKWLEAALKKGGKLESFAI